MKPNFALSLSFSGIQLLQRQDDGWGRVGDVDIASGDLAGDLSALLSKAQALGSGPVETKLIIPDDQIKYLTVDASGLDTDQLQSAVLAALDGATPYAVDELEFDFANMAGKIFVAAVAKETLQEAESFATEHGFSPVGFVAAPPAAQFPKEPNFGLTSAARAKGLSELQTDLRPAVATGEAKPVIAEPAPVERAPEPAPEAETTGATEATKAVPEPTKSDAQTEPTVAEPSKPAEAGKADASPTALKTEPAQVPEAPAPAMGFSSRRSSASLDKGASPKLDGVQRVTDPSLPPTAELRAETPVPSKMAASAPQITGKSEATLDEREVAANLAALRPGSAVDDFEDDIPPMPAGFPAAPRPDRLTGAADSAPMADLRAPASAEPEKPKRGAQVAALAGAAGTAALTSMRGLLSKRRKEKAPEAPAPAAKAPAEEDDEKQRMTVFGARKPKKTKEPLVVGGKPRFLGLILTAILLLFLVSVAAWASVFLDEGLARFFGGGERTRAIAELPAPEADPSDEDLIELASLEPGLGDVEDGGLPLDQGGLTQVEPPAPMITPQEAEATYAATGIWLATPPQPRNPPALALEDVYTASIDLNITGQDAFALSPLVQRRDLPPGISTPPLPAGSTFEFGPDGLVLATPEGAMTPEGALVFLGRPAVIPPAVPERLRQATPPADEEVSEEEPAPALPTIAALRPKARPDTLVEDNERTQLGGNTRDELAKLRPKLRPKLEKEVAEAEAAEAPASQLAVANSRTPAPRPQGFSRIVSRAQKQAESQQTTQVAAVAPRAVTPKIPSKSSVAKAATVKNAINLSRVNLIGVYGKPSSRRALVRLSSGRYKKVKVGDRVDGGRVSAIGEAQLVYTKSGRSVTLRMPKG